MDSFLAKTETMDRSDQLEYAARAVAAGLRWHLVAVNNNKRVGKAWETVASQLKFRLRDLMRKRFEYLLDVKRYERADEVGLKMLSRFPNDNEILLDVYHLQLKQTDLKTKGTDADLIYVSPRSGRAVSRDAGKPYCDRLLKLPRFLLEDDAAPTPADVLAGFALTGHFFERDVLSPHGLTLPASRTRLIELLARLDPHPEEALSRRLEG